MVKIKNNKKPQQKEVKDEVFTYASKEEEDEFLNFSDDGCDDSQLSSDNEAAIKAPRKKAFEVDMSDEEIGSDEYDSGADDDKISADEYDVEDEDMDDVSEDQEPFDRSNSRELSKFYSEQNERTVFVGNITPKVTTKVLIQLFNSKKAAGPGAVETARIRGAVTQEDSNNRNAKRRAIIQKKFKGEDEQTLCAFVVLKKKEDVEKCLQLNNHEINGRHIRVDIIRGKKMSYNSNNSIFIGNLPYDCNEEQVRSAFMKCGEIINVRLVRSKLDGSIKGFGYVEFSEAMGVDFSIKMKDHIKIGDRTVRIEKWSGQQTQQQKRKTPVDKTKKAVAGDKRKASGKGDTKSPAKRRKVIVPTNMRSLELNEYIRSKSKKMNKKIQKKRTFKKDQKTAKTKE